jgi:hypothetical protein
MNDGGEADNKYEIRISKSETKGNEIRKAGGTGGREKPVAEGLKTKAGGFTTTA